MTTRARIGLLILAVGAVAVALGMDDLMSFAGCDAAARREWRARNRPVPR